MFWEEKKVIAFLEEAMYVVTNYFDLLSNYIGPASASAVNSLLSTKTVDDSLVISVISEYVTKSLSTRINPQDRLRFIGEAREMSPDNPSWQGWLTELDVILRVKDSVNDVFVVWNEDGSERSFVCQFVRYIPLNGLVSQQFIKAQTFYIPIKFNNACFDLVYFGNDNLVFFQVTDSSSEHVYNVDILNNFAKQFNPKSIEYVIVCRHALMKFVPNPKHTEMENKWKKVPRPKPKFIVADSKLIYDLPVKVKSRKSTRAKMA